MGLMDRKSLTETDLKLRLLSLLHLVGLFLVFLMIRNVGQETGQIQNIRGPYPGIDIKEF
jgi:hypothetical protein